MRSPPSHASMLNSSQTDHTRELANRCTRWVVAPRPGEVREEIQFLLFLPNHVTFGELQFNMEIVGSNVEKLSAKT